MNMHIAVMHQFKYGFKFLFGVLYRPEDWRGDDPVKTLQFHLWPVSLFVWWARS